MNKGNLILVPNTISGHDYNMTLPKGVIDRILPLRHFIVEDLRTARRFLRRIGFKTDFDEVVFFLLNKHTDSNEIPSFLNPANDGHNIGLLSEAGVPCVADPGSDIVEIAQAKNIKVIPLVGPSSILLSLMASGFNGQNFCFLGYLPIDKSDRIREIKRLESSSAKLDQTQIFIEAPYRNQKMLESLLSNLSPKTKICIAKNITDENEYIVTKTVEQWKKQIPNINKENTIFLVYNR